LYFPICSGGIDSGGYAGGWHLSNGRDRLSAFELPSGDRNNPRVSRSARRSRRRQPSRASKAKAAPVPPRWLGRAETALALLATLWILLLHLRLLSRAGPLWRDEVNTLVVATQPTLGELWARLDAESFPMLPFVLVRAWCAVGLGSGDPGLRALGLLAGAFILAALWLNRRLLGPSVPLFSLAFFAVNPVVLRWGDSVRGYGLAALTILLAFSLLFRALRRPRPLDVGLAVLAAAASAQALYQNGVLLLAMGVAGAVVSWARGRRRCALLSLGIGAVAALSLLPYAGVIARSRESTVVSVEPITLGSLLAVVSRALGTDPGLAGPIRAMPALWAVLLIAAVVVAALRLRPGSAWGGSRRRRDLVLYGLLTMLIALPLHFAMLLRVGFRTQPWYYIALMGVTVSCAESILETPSAGLRLARLCGVGALMGLVSPGIYEYLGLRQTNMDWVARALGSPSKEDLVVVTPWYYGVSFNRYYHGAAPWTTIPPLEDKSLHRPDLVKRSLAAEDPVGPVFERVQATLASGNRVFLVGSLGGPVTERPPRLPPAPGAPTGWWQGTYGANWSGQLQFDLQNHAKSARALEIARSQPVIPYEIGAAWVVEGWR